MFINKTSNGLNNICGKNIARLRTELKLSQRELADRMQLVGPHGDVAVAGAGIKLNGVTVECVPDGVHQNIGIPGGNFTGAVVDDGLFPVGLLLTEGDDITAENHVVRVHRNADTQRLQR